MEGRVVQLQPVAAHEWNVLDLLWPLSKSERLLDYETEDEDESDSDSLDRG